MRTKILLNDGYSVNVLELEAEGVNSLNKLLLMLLTGK